MLWELLAMILEICGKAFPFSEHGFFIGVSIEFDMQFVIDDYGFWFFKARKILPIDESLDKNIELFGKKIENKQNH